MPELLDHEATAPDFGEPADLFDYDESSWQDAGEPVDEHDPSTAEVNALYAGKVSDITLRDYQEDAVAAIFNALEFELSTLLVLATGLGKCLARGTPVIMHDGTTKPVEAVAVGDKLMGPDSQPRNVLSLARGREMMYRVTPTKGEPYTVNESHIVSLRNESNPGRILNIPVRDLIGHWKSNSGWKGWRVPGILSGDLTPQLDPIVDFRSQGVDDYFGFEIDGDRLFLLGDFTVTHNTVVFSTVIKRWKDHQWKDGRKRTGRVLVLAHRQELIIQAANEIYEVTGLRPDVDMADQHAIHGEFSDGGPIVGSVQTVSRLKRLRGYDWKEFDLIIIDEAHRAGLAVKSYQAIIRAARLGNPDIRLLGVTATPYRGDKSDLSNVFGSVCLDRGIRFGIDEGWLVPVYQHPIIVNGLDFSRVRMHKGELKDSDLSAAFDAVPEQVVQAIAATIEEVGQKKCLWFTVSVAQAETVANEICKISGHRAKMVCGETEDAERKATLAALKSGEINHATNCAVFVEGFNEPTLEAIVVMRPYKQIGNLIQVIGRGTRPLRGVVDGLLSPDDRRMAIAASGKPHVMILDFAGNAGRHDLATVAEALGETDQLAIERAISQADRYLAGQDIRQAVKKAREDIDREKKEEDEKKAAEIAKAKEERDRLNAEYVRKKQEEAARFAEYVKASYTSERIDPFHSKAAPSADRFAASGTASKLTEYQCKKLMDNGINPDSLTLWQAKAKLAELADKPTPNQVETLAKFGESVVPTKARAEVLFSIIKQDDGKWKKRDFPLTPAAFRVRELEGRKPAYVVDVVSPAGREIRVKRNNKVGGQWVPQAIIFNTPQAANQYISQAVDAVAFGGGI